MSDWISVEDKLPEAQRSHVVVHCEGGNIDITYCLSDRENAKNFFLDDSSSYSRKLHGKHSCCFQLSHEYGYKVTHWMPLPEPPK